MKRLAPALLIGLFCAGAAQAQGRYGDRPGDFDFYVLALSWSPGFCEYDGPGRNRDQCFDGSGLGFVVHGLWPQNERGFPSDCGPAGRMIPRAALDQVRGLYPTESLARYQWRKHGTCSGSSPSAYFADVRRARAMVAIPEPLRAPRDDRSWTPPAIERAFVEANPGLRADMVSVSCRRGLMQEVRICLSRDLRGFRRCEEVDRSGCRGGGEIVVKGLR